MSLADIAHRRLESLGQLVVTIQLDEPPTRIGKPPQVLDHNTLDGASIGSHRLRNRIHRQAREANSCDFGFWSLEFRVWSLEFGVSSLEFGVWSLELPPIANRQSPIANRAFPPLERPESCK